MILLIAACGLSLLAAITVYLASPNQQIQRKPRPKKTSYLIAVLAVALAFVILLQFMASVAATFLLVTIFMVYWSCLPLIVATFYHGSHHNHAKSMRKKP